MNEETSGLQLPAFSPPPKAVAIDMDGTLLDTRSSLSRRNSAALEKLLGLGFPVIIATSRAHRSVRRLLGMDIANACSLVAQNGGFGLGRPPLSGKIKEAIPISTAKALISAVTEMEPEIHITMECDGEYFGTNNPRAPVKLWEINSATPEMQLSLEQAMRFIPAKFALGGLGRDISHVAEMVHRRFGNDLAVYIEAKNTFLNVTSKTASKSGTLKRLLASRNISLNEAAALGDDLPDYDMLSACGIAIAMGNAVPEIKAICKYITATNNEDGVALVLEKIIAARGKGKHQ